MAAQGGGDMEALMALRSATSAGETPTVEGDEVVLASGKRFPKTTVTPVKSSNNLLTLASLLHFLETSAMSVGDYIRAARQAKVQRVAHLDREPILGFLQGKREWISQIQAEQPTAAAAESGTVAEEKAGAADGAARKRKGAEAGLSPEEVLLRRITKREGCQRDRDSILQSSQRFTEALMIESEASRGSKIREVGKVREAANKTPRGYPIIVVPAAMTAPVNMYNVKALLEEGRYQHTDEARKERPVKEQFLIVEKKVGEHGFIKFKVVDSVLKFQNHHWDRLAAVFAQGPAWQFKDWRWKDTATIFDNCLGLYVYFDDQKLPPHIGAWNVLVHPLKKQSRHKDSVEVHKIWQEVERFLSTRKPELLAAGRQ